MKPVTLRVWVNDDAPDLPTGDYGRIDAGQLADYLRAADDPSISLLTAEDISNIARGDAEREYRATIEGIIDDVRQAVKDGEITDRDGAMERIEEIIDGHHDVIYTACAMEVCRISRNDGAYFDDFGTEGAVTDGGIEWSRLAYSAMRADVMEEIGDLDELFQNEDEDEDEDEEVTEG